MNDWENSTFDMEEQGLSLFRTPIYNTYHYNMENLEREDDRFLKPSITEIGTHSYGTVNSSPLESKRNIKDYTPSPKKGSECKRDFIPINSKRKLFEGASDIRENDEWKWLTQTPTEALSAKTTKSQETKRKRKSLRQIQILREGFKMNQIWTKHDIATIAKRAGLTCSQWLWDQKRKVDCKKSSQLGSIDEFGGYCKDDYASVQPLSQITGIDLDQKVEDLLCDLGDSTDGDRTITPKNRIIEGMPKRLSDEPTSVFSELKAACSDHMVTLSIAPFNQLGDFHKRAKLMHEPLDRSAQSTQTSQGTPEESIPDDEDAKSHFSTTPTISS